MTRARGAREQKVAPGFPALSEAMLDWPTSLDVGFARLERMQNVIDKQ